MFCLELSARCAFRTRKLRIFCRITPALALAAFLLYASPATAQNASGLPQLSHSIREGEFVSAVGRRAALLGTDDRGFEAWVYPLKIFRELHLRFHIDGRILQAETLARTVITRPESSTIVYSGASFNVRETLFVPIHESGALITFEIQTNRPLEIELAFVPDFQLAWPAEMGPTHLNWDSTKHALLFTSQNHPYAAVVGSLKAREAKSENDNGSELGERSLFLGVTTHGAETKILCIAASLRDRTDAAKTYDRLISSTKALTREAANFYRDYLHHTLNIAVPDAEIQQAYDWARINLLQAVVDNPLVGTGLIAGYGLSGEAQRPGFDWFFGRDALWTSLALDAQGDFTDTRTALEFLAKYQRADGKISHEVPQSASLVPWFEDYPYGYASADATPLYLIVMNDYVQRSGDLPFASREWESIWRAYQFMNSTLDVNGFAQNSGVGHGWVESGPLLPVRTEIYQAALGIEAARAMSSLARLLGKNELVTALEQTFERERTRLNQLFWSQEEKIFAFALDSNDHRVDETTVLPTVPMWFGLLDRQKATETLARLAAPDLQTDWGMRILSSSSPKYAGDGYHFGSVWPLFTGWASVGEYRYHRQSPAYLNLRANALLALDGSPGHITEVLNGNSYKPLSTSTPQQIWSAAMIVSPLLRGLFGLETSAVAGEISLTPHIPADWTSFAINDLHVGSSSLTLRFHKNANELSLETTSTGSGKCTMDFSPALSLRANVTAVRLNGRAVPYQIETNDADQHISVHFEVPLGKSTLHLRLNDDFELSYVSHLPAPGSTSQGLRILFQSWTPERDRLDMDVAGVPGNTYELSLSNVGEVISADGAELNTSNPHAARLLVRFPARPDAYTQRRVILRFAPKRQSASPKQN
jgi:glycogen debranching enzyme